MKRPKLMLATKDKRTYDTFYQQLTEYFKEDDLCIVPADSTNCHDSDLILLSSNKLMDTQKFPQRKTIVARRSIDISMLEELVQLPPDTECIVANNLPENTDELIDLLKSLGIQLKMHPYYPGAEQKVEGIDIAIVPAVVELVPPTIKNIIDIGIRPLDFSTIIEVSMRLGLDIEKVNSQSTRYVKEIISLSRKLSSSLEVVKKLNHQLEAIFDTVHDGLIATDDHNTIIKLNKSSKNILGLSNGDSIIGKNAGLIFPRLFTKYPKTTENKETEVVTVNEKKLVVNKSEIVVNNQKIGELTAFQDVTRIQYLEKSIRKEMQKIGFSSRYTSKDILGSSKKIKETLNIVKKIAKTDHTVLILGENGTGKELFAHTIHDLSARCEGPLIPVNFAGLPQSLAESELFGYEDGTFTGAKKGGKQGLFEIAHNGTIFLDEIGDAPLNIQTLLLRVLQEKQVMRVGGRSLIPVNVRVIAATNKDLKQLVQEGKFREDLYYRLFVLPIRVPPLRERKEDILDLLHYFIESNSAATPSISPEVIKELAGYDWPGNVRELIGVVQYMTAVMENNEITLSDLPEQFKEKLVQEEQREDDLLEILRKEGDLNEFYVILSSLSQAKKQMKNIGRGKVVETAATEGFPLSEQKVRKRMAILRDHGLIYSGNKGKGSKISDSGESLLKMIKPSLEVEV
ncbi:sigma-54-dependent Fis family transcriptional regulator [Planomicrobium sp. CPCC 101110]|uniref:sigma-54 interaction domain-containing protein n=1 Tax=Planomicrobium sp. CPCC 101110 TaxID=2599619 RepID=UPI0011B89A79|nr:sigma 54-interacting transcriptional regulator [Planomicrobium sp. CPCC 101110]TWT25354.1 PAS domain-containing protein [Planomicrobium sp. CPCC 101110]